MTKRHYPWKNDIPLQLKTHISTKELANGVDGETYKNIIQGHTQQLLLEGAKDYYSNSLSDHMEIETTADETEITYSTTDQRTTQKTITDFFTKGCKAQTGKRMKAKLAISPCGHSGPTTKCSFCDLVLCRACSQVCHICHESFCSNCSLLSYEHSVEIPVCLGCKR